MQIQLALLFLFYFVVIQSKKLQLQQVCTEYLKCNDELEGLQRRCENETLFITKETEKCEIEFTSDFQQLEELTATNKASTLDCIKHSVKSQAKHKFSREKVKFCVPFLKGPEEEEKENTTCVMAIMKTRNRCQALRQCCDPAPRCDQATDYSELGRKATALKEELDIKMADCLQNLGKSSMAVAQEEKATVEHCPKYLQCQKDLLRLRSSCAILNKLPQGGDAYAWSPLYNELPQPIDVHDYECKLRYSKQYEDVLKRRQQAQDYLENCVPVANVTREFREKQQPCLPLELLDSLPSEKPTEDCLADVIIQNKECLKLRNCCVQADVCERNAMYGVLADEYLLAVTALKTEMDRCYHTIRRSQ